jgi:GDPmannose 4,6-dehydratase
MKKAIITGASGQDAFYLHQFLLSKNYQVHLWSRKSIDYSHVEVLSSELKKIQPDEIYHLGAFSSVGNSQKNEKNIFYQNVDSSFNLFLAVKESCPKCRLFNASSGEIFQRGGEIFDENSGRNPKSIYGISKLTTYQLVSFYRDNFQLFMVSGILFNHESPKRSLDFVSQKIISGIVAISQGRQDFIELGNLDAIRDWGHAQDYVEAMWLMLQADQPRDYVIATGVGYSVREFVEMGFRLMNLSIMWKNEKNTEKEIAVNTENGKTVVKINPTFFRKNDFSSMVGNPSAIKNDLGWSAKHNFQELITWLLAEEQSKFR